MAWLGRKKVAFIPVFRPTAHPPDQVPTNWEDDIRRRVFFDPAPVTNADRSLRSYVHAASSGRADIDVVITPRKRVDQDDVPLTFLEGQMGSQLRAQGFDAAALVMLGGAGAATAEQGGFWVRFAMLESLGAWAMELIHCLSGFDDLYTFDGDLGRFDEMAGIAATHPCAFTKAALGWLDPSAVVAHTVGASNYNLHSIGLRQPPPSDRVAAIRIGTSVPYVMVEARQRVDQFDANIPSEGVIIYRVQTSSPQGTAQNALAPIKLLTQTALTPGQTFTADTGARVSVETPLSGGFAVRITLPVDSQCARIREQIALIEGLLAEETDLQTLKQLRQERARLRSKAHLLGCP